MAALNAGAAVTQAASILMSSGASLQVLVDDLLDFDRTQLGLGIRVMPTEVDVAALFADTLKQLRAAHSRRRLKLDVTGNARGV